MKVIFLGSPELSAEFLKVLIDSHHEVVGVVTQPDKPSGRGHKLTETPVKRLAVQHGIPVYQFVKIRREGEVLRELNADIMVTAAFGQILSQANIDMTPYGIVNVHPSILPKYRGSCPINWAIINGETRSGVTIMKTDAGMDSGDIISCKEFDIRDTDTVTDIEKVVVRIGGPMLIEALDNIERGTVQYTPQNHDEMTYFPMLDKDMGKIDFNKTPREIVRWCNGLNPWPLAYIKTADYIVKVYSAEAVNYDGDEANGTVICSTPKQGLVVKCEGGAVRLRTLQAPGGKVLSDRDFLNGRHVDRILNDAE